VIVCQCKGVTEAAIRKAVREGAASIEEVGLACKAGTDCGGCRPTIQLIMIQEQYSFGPASPLVAEPALAAT
jgi:bacterioferritin-associated ferredoxin